MINKIDIAIIIFILYHLIRGYKIGFSKSLFLSFRFIISFLLTRYVYITYLQAILESKFYERYQIIMHEIITKFMSVVMYQLLDMNPKVLAISLFIVISILINILFYTLHTVFNQKTLKWIDKNLGLIFGLIKATIYIMIIITVVDPIIQKHMEKEFHEVLANAKLLKYFYSYNFIAIYFTF